MTISSDIFIFHCDVCGRELNPAEWNALFPTVRRCGDCISPEEREKLEREERERRLADRLDARHFQEQAARALIAALNNARADEWPRCPRLAVEHAIEVLVHTSEYEDEPDDDLLDELLPPLC